MTIGFNRTNLPSCWQEFNHINRYWDNTTGLATAKILPGEFYVTAQNEVITTVLGSCIAVCICDKQAGIGGMNHFMLPVQSGSNQSVDIGHATRYGNFAMEQMINDILRNGGAKHRLELKIFGGAKVVKGLSNIGEKNIRFIRDYIALEELNLLAEDVGGVHPRKVIYAAKTGKVMLKKLYSEHNRTIQLRDEQYKSRIINKQIVDDVELFD
jgi:chemotaxis protein CheD